MGEWLAVNGEAIYGTRPWVRAEGETDSGHPVRFTQDENGRFAVIFGDLTSGSLRLLDVGPETINSVELLGHGSVPWQRDGPDLIVELPEDNSLKVAYTLVLR